MKEWTPEVGTETLRGAFDAPPLLRYTIDCPAVRSALPPALRINAFCRGRAQALERFCCGPALAEARRQRAVMSSGFTPLEITASVQILRCGAGLLSGFADGYRQMGARGSFLTRLSRTFSLETGQEIPLPALFRQGAPWQRTVFAALDGELRRRVTEEPGSYFKNAAALMRQRLSLHGYYLADDGLAVWFPQNIIAPGNTGLPTFLIRYDGLNGLLRKPL